MCFVFLSTPFSLVTGTISFSIPSVPIALDSHTVIIMLLMVTMPVIQ